MDCSDFIAVKCLLTRQARINPDLLSIVTSVCLSTCITTVHLAGNLAIFVVLSLKNS